MQSAFESGEKGQNGGLDDFDGGGCDITSLRLTRRGRYEFDLTFHVRFTHPTPDQMDSIPPLELPAPAMDCFADSGFDDYSTLGEPGKLRANFSIGVLESLLKEKSTMVAPPLANELNRDLEYVPNMINHTNLGANLGFDIDVSSQVEKAPLQMVFPKQIENFQTAIHEPFLSAFNQNNRINAFNTDELRRGMNSSEGFEAKSTFPTFSQTSTFSSGNLNSIYGLGFNPVASSTSAEIGISSDEFNFSTNTPRSSQKSPFFSSASSLSSSNLSTTIVSPSISANTSPSISAHTSPSALATIPRLIDSFPEGYFCRLCSRTFKRPSDLKRHEGVHFPEQRKHHCKQSGCERKGQNGFYRRDKLRIHERQVHGFDH